MVIERSFLFALCAVLLATFTFNRWAPAYAMECPVVTDPKSLIASLAEGGYILLFRHADKYAKRGEPMRPDNLERTLPEDCKNPAELEVLNDNGLTQARNIGLALAGDTVGRVLRSNACRTIETAETAFGKPTERYGDLLAELRKQPANGKNTMIVSHSPKIQKALDALEFGVKRLLSCGEAAVIDPVGNSGRPKCMALVLSKDWDRMNAEPEEWANTKECPQR